MITTNVFKRIFRIKYGERTGTCFTINVEDEMYLITATHIVKEITGRDSVQIYYNGEWVNYPVILVGHTPGTVDISVLTAKLSFSVDYPMPASAGNLMYSQDVYFLGFPNVVDVDDTLPSALEINNKFPIPIVKHAIFSSVGNDKHFLIDGYANPGFSGGPMVFKPKDSNDYHVAGVIVNYRPEIIPVYGTELEAKNDGSGGPPIGYFRGNSGIITVSKIGRAVDLIKTWMNS